MTLGNALHLSPEASLSLGWAYGLRVLPDFRCSSPIPVFFTLCYSPLKAIIQGTPKALWPELMTPECDGDAVYRHVDAVRAGYCLHPAGFVCGGTASAFFNKLTLMANVSMTLPYLFLALAFPFFKARQDLDRPFVIFKTRKRSATSVTAVSRTAVMIGRNVFTIIQPVVEAGDWDSTLWMIGCPVFFLAVSDGDLPELLQSHGE